MKFDIIATGSSGNMFTLDNEIAIDCGVPFSKLANIADKLKYVLLTHIHGDHFNKTAIRKLFIQNENVKFICGEFLKNHFESEMLDNLIIVEAGKLYKLKTGHIISPVIAYHDVPNFGYRIIKDGHKHFHMTDTSTLDGIDAKSYDSASIECNHDRKTAISIIDEKARLNEFCHLKRTLETHLSVGEAVDFVSRNKIKKLYPVHIGDSTRNEVMKMLKEDT